DAPSSRNHLIWSLPSAVILKQNCRPSYQLGHCWQSELLLIHQRPSSFGANKLATEKPEISPLTTPFCRYIRGSEIPNGVRNLTVLPTTIFLIPASSSSRAMALIGKRVEKLIAPIARSV